MKLTSFYHIYAGGLWQEPLAEYMAALEGFNGEQRYVVVDGDEANRAIIREILNDHSVMFHPPGQAFEDVTLGALWDHAQGDDGAVMYAHTKGAYRPTEHNHRWRRMMTETVIAPWYANLRCLEYADAIGAFFIKDWPDKGDRFFGGNFWLATSEYIRKLPRLVLPQTGEPMRDRYKAEGWIGLADPKALDVCPGIPSPAYFGLATAG